MKVELYLALSVFLLIVFISCTNNVYKIAKNDPSPVFDNAPRISKDKLKAMLNKPDLVIIDVRSASAWNRSDLKIKGAVREEYWNFDSWADKYSKGKTIVLYCS
jgi:predicted sulfurtransferase